MNTMDWSVLRDFLAVAETGSFSKAAERLRTSQPTLSRRIAALEAQLKMRLFVRTPRGLLLTDEGETVLEGARRVEQAALAIERSADGAQDKLTGIVRVSLTEGLGTMWLPEKLAAFHAHHGQLCVELLIDNRAVDLVRREADIAVRLFRPQQSDLLAKHVADITMGLYAAKSYLARAGAPAEVKDLKGHRLVAFDEAMLARNPAVQRLESLFSPENIVHRSNSFSGQLAATRAGIGLGVHDCFMADADPDLVRLMPREFNHTMEIWLVTHPDVRRSARIRAVYDFLSENFQKDRDRLAGVASAQAAAARRSGARAA
ncbi:MAG: LysR family transcriptional regulator [Rhodospirillaceae bacterium]|nr:LysR family transcriptional regulator [Rhodospirillaceae bacterium]